MDTIKLLIDTDIGDDVDDAFALCLAMTSPEIELLGVTTVFKNVTLRAMIAKRLLTLGGFGAVPVVPGASTPLANPDMFGQAVDFESAPISWRESYAFPLETSCTATDFIISVLERSAEPITIVTMGALTNIADVLRRRPDLKSKIKCLHVMGGAYYINWSEYNFVCDPEAADMVLCSGLKIKAVGIDTTLKCVLNLNHLQRLKDATAHPALAMLMEMCEVWCGESSRCAIMHDPLALWTSFSDSFVEFSREVFRVECQGRYSRGLCVRLSDHNWKVPVDHANLYVAKTVQAEQFVDTCIERICGLGR